MADASEFVKSTASQRTWLAGAGGWLVTGIACPKCGLQIVYNGNYFCERWGYTRNGGERVGGPCDWALPHPATRKADKAICDALGIDYG